MCVCVCASLLGYDHKDWTRIEVCNSAKRSSLSQFGEKFYSVDPRFGILLSFKIFDHEFNPVREGGGVEGGKQNERKNLSRFQRKYIIKSKDDIKIHVRAYKYVHVHTYTTTRNKTD